MNKSSTQPFDQSNRQSDFIYYVQTSGPGTKDSTIRGLSPLQVHGSAKHQVQRQPADGSGQEPSKRGHHSTNCLNDLSVHPSAKPDCNNGSAVTKDYPDIYDVDQPGSCLYKTNERSQDCAREPRTNADRNDTRAKSTYQQTMPSLSGSSSSPASTKDKHVVNKSGSLSAKSSGTSEVGRSTRLRTETEYDPKKYSKHKSAMKNTGMDRCYQESGTNVDLLTDQLNGLQISKDNATEHVNTETKDQGKTTSDTSQGLLEDTGQSSKKVWPQSRVSPRPLDSTRARCEDGVNPADPVTARVTVNDGARCTSRQKPYLTQGVDMLPSPKSSLPENKISADSSCKQKVLFEPIQL